MNRRSDNRIHAGRIPAALVALVYLFFSTFGVAAHSHLDSHEAGGASRPGKAISSRGASHATLSALNHCPMCEWQANSVSPALGASHLGHVAYGIKPSLFIILNPSLTSYIVTRAACRAPPAA